MKEYTGILKMEVTFTIHGMGGNKAILKSAIRQQVAGMVRQVKDAGLTIDSSDLDADGDEKISVEIEEMMERV